MVSVKSVLLFTLLGLAAASKPGCRKRGTIKSHDANSSPEDYKPTSQTSGGGEQNKKSPSEHSEGNNGKPSEGNNGKPSEGGKPAGRVDIGPTITQPGPPYYARKRVQADGPGATWGKFPATFTVYGSNDKMGSGNCVKRKACGSYGSQGYTAAVSQNVYGVGNEKGTGPGCNTCFKLHLEKGPNGQPMEGSIVVMIDDLCPAGGTGMCALSTFPPAKPNALGGWVNFDICSNSRGQKDFFHSADIGLGSGQAEKVDCSEWHGVISDPNWGPYYGQ